MKRVIDGKTYNTATSARAARWDYTDDRQNEVEATLYRTRRGCLLRRPRLGGQGTMMVIGVRSRTPRQ